MHYCEKCNCKTCTDKRFVRNTINKKGPLDEQNY